MNRTQVYFPKSQIETLKKAAKKQRTTVSGVLRELVERELEPRFHPKKKVQKDGFDMMFEVLKQVKRTGVKGPKDLAINMDKYLYGEV